MKILNSFFLIVFSSVVLISNNSNAFPAVEPANRSGPCDESGQYPICVNGGGISSFFPKSDAPPRNLIKRYDVVVVGGGLAGLMATVYLTDRKKSVLLIEKENQLGGLAAGHTAGIRYDRGAAYFTDAYEEEAALLKHIGLRDYEKFEIPEPIDSYYWNDKFYPGIWEEHTLEELPGSFDLFKVGLQAADYLGQIPNQPFEDGKKWKLDLSLDTLSARDWIREMPKVVLENIEKLKSGVEAANMKLLKALKAGKKSDKKIKELEERARNGHSLLRASRVALKRFNAELQAGKLEGKSGMDSVVGLMDLYCRSALGALTQNVSAMAFANFYISEIVPRFTTPIGTGFASAVMENMLHARPSLVSITLSSTVKKISQTTKGVNVVYQNGPNNYAVDAKFVVFAAQIGLAPKIIEGFKEKAPVQANLMKDMGYSHYSVHVIEVDGHPFRATYDTWTRAPDYSDSDFTDVILGRWMDPLMLGYEGYRNFDAEPPDNRGVLSVYQPIAMADLKDYENEEAIAVARKQVDRLEEVFGRLPPELWKGPLKIQRVETNRWPFSVHIAAPGHFIEKAKILRRPFGRIFFAHSNLGTPAFEEALFRGHCAADHIEEATNKSFKYEKWSRCPTLSEIRMKRGELR